MSQGDDFGEYERKRDFGSTAEPRPNASRRNVGAALRRPGTQRPPPALGPAARARRVAVSWAVPNGIPLDPAENRKAVHTEDHPLEYLELRGRDPEGRVRRRDDADLGPRHLRAREVGARGKSSSASTASGCSGRYALFRAGKEEKDWMIHRIDPPVERRDPFPESVVPMLAKLAKLPRATRAGRPR